MLHHGDLGFGAPVLLLILSIVSFLVLTVRWKWRASTIRKGEIRRLVFLASQESVRAELEAAMKCTNSVPAVPRQCAVCYRPTTTRCSQCKAVRYCSGKCQIIHWRQGHKKDCRPPAIIVNLNGTGDDLAKKSGSPIQELLVEPLLDCDHRSNFDSPDGFQESPVSAKMTHINEICSEKVSSDFDVKSVTEQAESSIPAIHMSSNPYSLGSCMETCLAAHSSSAGYSEASSISAVPLRHGPEYIIAKPRCSSFSVSVNNFSHSSKFKETLPSSNCSSSSTISSYDKHDGPTALPYEESRATHVLSQPQNVNQECSSQPEETSVLQFSFNLSSQAVPSMIDVPREKCSLPSQRDKPVFSKELDTQTPTRGPQLTGAERFSSVSHEQNTDWQMMFRRQRSVPFGSSSDGSLPYKFEHKCLSTSSSAKDDPCPCGDGSRSCKFDHHGLSSSSSAKDDPRHKFSFTVDPVTGTLSNGDTLRTSMMKVVQQLKLSKRSKRHCPLPNGQDIARESKILFPYDLFTKLFHDKVELRPCGLTNCGNSCYANAVLQCLTFTQPLTAYLLQGLHSKTCTKKMWCFTCEFENLALKAREGKSPLSPVGILSQIKLGHGKEEDAHEFLRYAIDSMQSVCLMEAGINAKSPVAEETTLVKLMFGGYLKSKVKCMNCHGKSERQERMMDLTVEIDGDINSLEEALQQFTSTETLDGENKYWCGRCKSYEKAKKKLTILEAPNILTIALKRFQSGKFGKLNKLVQFPDVLSLIPYMSGSSDRSPLYKLYAVVVHLDIMNAAFSGHYICFVKTIHGKWFKIDDSMVKPVDPERVLSSKGAYMLLYARCSPRAPNLLRQLMSHDPARRATCTGHIPSSSLKTRPLCSREEENSAFMTPHGSAELNCYTDCMRYPEHWIPKAESFSDSSSIFSCSTDEGSCSTDSTRDSLSTDESAECMFRDTNLSAIYSPLRDSQFSRPSHLYMASGCRDSYGTSLLASPRGEFLWGDGVSPQFSRNSRLTKLTNNSNSTSDTDSDILGWANFREAKCDFTESKCMARKQTNY